MLSEILSCVAQEYGVSVADILGRRRSKTIARARHRAMFRVRKELEWSYPEIGRAFYRDHTTAMHGVARGAK